jgi:hypothetical protein
LRQQVGFDAFAGLVTRPQVIAKGLDDVIGRNREVSGPILDHAKHRRQNTSDGSDFSARHVLRGRQSVVVPE